MRIFGFDRLFPRRRARARPFTAGVAVALLAGCGGGGSGTPPPPAPSPPPYRASGEAAAGNVMVHLFEWRWADIARECEVWLGPRGYAAVQISPPSEHAVFAADGYPWWQRYQTVSYSLARSRSGTLAEFDDMVARCHAAGVGIIADAVINHMTAGGGSGSNGSVYTKYDYPNVPYTAADFHPTCGINNYNDTRQVQFCELVGLADLKTEDDSVRDRIAAYLIALHARGVKGFRIDAAKHIAAADVDQIIRRVNEAAVAANRVRPYVFLEIINNPGEAVTAEQYYGVGFASGGAADITEFIYSYRVSDAFLGRNAATLAGLGNLVTGLIPTDKALVFTDNHDNQRGANLYYGDGSAHVLANVFTLGYGYGAVSLMSSYGFDRSSQAGRDAGPPGANGVTASTFDGSGNSRCSATAGGAQPGVWICEHRIAAIANMVAFRKATAGLPATAVQTFGGSFNRIWFERRGVGQPSTGFVAINRDNAGGAATFTTSLPAGSYCNIAAHDYAPAAGAAAARCSGAPIVLTGGAFTTTVPANGAIVLHTAARL